MSEFMPTVGGFLTIDLPGERTRAVVERVINEKSVIVRLLTFTTSRDHRYKKGDFVPCGFETDGFSQSCWVAINESGLRERAIERTDPDPEVVEEPKPVFQPVEPIEPSFVLSEN